MHRLVTFATVLGLVLAAAGVATAGVINSGDIIVVDRGNGTLDDVNPITGASGVIASGFSNPQGLAIDSQGYMFVSDIGTSTIDQVNPTNGTVTTYSGNGVGSGPALDRPFEMAFNTAGTLYVADGQTPNGNSTNVIAIAPNGDRTVVAGNNGSSNNLFGEFLAGLALDSHGNIFASAPTAHTIYGVGSGTATFLSAALSAPQGLAFGNSQLLAVNGNPSDPSIWSINPTNGNATILSDNNGPGTGAAFDVLRGITVAPDGTIYVTDVGDNEIYAVNSQTGDRSVVSGGGVGGTTFGGITYGIAVYPTLTVGSVVPEPSSLTVLGVMSATFAALFGWRRRNARPAS